MTRVLLVEDDQRVADAVIEALSTLGYRIEHCSTGRAALEAGEADVMLLDLGLPDMDGVEVCRTVSARSTMPIIAVTARGAVTERVDGLRAGADDYVVKPFSIAELEARIEAVLRRADRREAPDQSPITVGDLRIDRGTREVRLGSDSPSLTPKEFDLLILLASEPGRVFSRGELLLQVWHTSWEGRSRTVDVHVGSIRQKLGRPQLIRTIHGVGYTLDGDSDGDG